MRRKREVRMVRRATTAFLILAQVVVICIVAVIMAEDYASGEVNVYLKMEDFTWKEYDQDGSRLLKESGPRIGLGIVGRNSPRSGPGPHWILTGKFEILGGSVDYDGQTQDGIPVTTDVDYAGIRPELNLGPRFIFADTSSIEPFFGFGWMNWERDIKSRGYAKGYKEEWTSTYTLLGLKNDFLLSSGLRLLTEFQVKFPLDNKNVADLGGLDIHLEPGRKPFFYAEAGLAWPRLKANIFYETMRFSASDEVIVYNQILDEYWVFLQPKSEAEIFGISLGVIF